MANNILIKDETGRSETTRTIKTTETAGVNTVHVNIDAGTAVIGTVATTSDYPTGATALTGASGNVAAATAAATLTAVSGKTTHITGFEITGAGATGAAVVTVTVTGTITGTLSYTYAAVAGATLINTPLIVEFPVPIPASATNTNIVVSCPTLGAGNLNNTAVAHGYNL